MPVNFVAAVLVVSANASWLSDWYPVILMSVVLTMLIAVTVYGVRRALSWGDTPAAVAMICGWGFALGWLIAVIYLLAVDRPRRASGHHGVADVGPLPAIDLAAKGPLGDIRNPILNAGAIATGVSDNGGMRYVPDLEAGLTAVVEYLGWDRKWHVKGIGPAGPESSEVGATVPNVGGTGPALFGASDSPVCWWAVRSCSWFSTVEVEAAHTSRLPSSGQSNPHAQEVWAALGSAIALSRS